MAEAASNRKSEIEIRKFGRRLIVNADDFGLSVSVNRPFMTT